MKIVIPGGSGQVGHILSRRFHARGHVVTVLSRRAYADPWCVDYELKINGWMDELYRAAISARSRRARSGARS